MILRRQAVVDSGGWDETLNAGQDRDCVTTIALGGADIRYQAGCLSVHRRYGKVTVSTSDLRRWLENHQRILEKAEESLVQADRLVLRCRRGLASSYFSLSRNYYDVDRSMYRKLVGKVLSLCPDFEPHESSCCNAAWRLLGFAAAHRLASYKRQLSGGMIAAWSAATRHGERQ